MEMTWIVLWSKTNTTHNQLKQLKIQVQNNQNHNIIFKYSLQDYNLGVILILDVLKKILWQGSLTFSKGYTLNLFQVKPISIGFHFLFQLEMQNLQVNLN